MQADDLSLEVVRPRPRRKFPWQVLLVVGGCLAFWATYPAISLGKENHRWSVARLSGHFTGRLDDRTVEMDVRQTGKHVSGQALVGKGGRYWKAYILGSATPGQFNFRLELLGEKHYSVVGVTQYGLGPGFLEEGPVLRAVAREDGTGSEREFLVKKTGR